MRHGLVRRQRDIDTSPRVEINLRSEGELTQRFPHGGHENLENSLLVGKLNLRLRRVDIDIDGLGVDIKIDEERRLVVVR